MVSLNVVEQEKECGQETAEALNSERKLLIASGYGTLSRGNAHSLSSN